MNEIRPPSVETRNKTYGRELGVSVTILSALLLSGCDKLGNQDQWQGWVYPDKNALVVSIPMGKFESLEQCRSSAQTAIRYLEERTLAGKTVKADYECGLNCEPMSGGLNMCTQTLR